MSYVSLASAIITKLNEVSEINVVYNYEAKELLGYPAVTVTALGHVNTPHDTAGNVRNFQFVVRAYFPTSIAQDAETILRDLADKIIVKLEEDPSLGGACDYTRATEGKFLYQEREVPVRIVEITINCIKRLNR